jgi:sulfur carrier protein ThiS
MQVTVKKFGSSGFSGVDNLSDNATVGDVLRELNMDSKGFKIQADGVDVSLNTVLNNGAKIILVPKVDGGC